MVTLTDLINGRTHVSSFSEKVERLQAILDNVIKPLEDNGYNITVTKGLLANTEVSDISDVFLRRDHIYGYGVDITTDKESDVINFIKNIKGASVNKIEHGLHVRYEEIPEQEEEDAITDDKIIEEYE